MYDSAKNRQYYIRIGICPICKKVKPEPGYKVCKRCRERQNAINTKSRHKNLMAYNAREAVRKRKVYADRVKNGVCTRCGKNPAVEGHRTCRKCHPLFKSDRVMYRMYADVPGICYQCGARAIDGMRVCRKHYRLLTGREWDG